VDVTSAWRFPRRWLAGPEPLAPLLRCLAPLRPRLAAGQPKGVGWPTGCHL